MVVTDCTPRACPSERGNPNPEPQITIMNPNAVHTAAFGAPAKKKRGLLAKLGKLPPDDVRPLVYPELEGGYPFEPGTKNYHKLVEMRRGLQEKCRKGPCGFYVSDSDPFHPDHYIGAKYFRASVPDKNLFPDPGLEELEVANPPSKNGPISNESKLGISPSKDVMRAFNIEVCE